MKTAAFTVRDIRLNYMFSGSGVARGYLNRARTYSRNLFLIPFIAGNVYDTGDLGRWIYLTVQSRFFWGDDHQVKIRGYRIGVIEIESKLLECSKKVKERLS
jgi:arthrofactin-type cyclic lipopeptide synthetase C